MITEYNPSEYKPERFGRFFADISAIPRGSGNEGAICDYLRAFASQRDLFCISDAHNNVFMRKTYGHPRHSVLLQAHIDMVCEKNSGTKHDFNTDPLELYVQDGFLRAKGTTLGGDDGAGVALMLAMLDDTDLTDLTLECLFTSEEEIGMGGARSFDYSVVTAESYINLDCEGEGVAWVSCAGGMDTTLTRTMERLPSQNTPFKLEIYGLAGGHSGADIDKNRASANKLMGIMLARLYEFAPFSLVSIDGGNKRNAISRECRAIIVTNEPEKTKELLGYFAGEIKSSLSDTDRGFRFKLSKTSQPKEMSTLKSTSAVLSMLILAPDGVLNMSPKLTGLVETSTSLGVVETVGDEISLTWMSRSSVDYRFDELEVKFDRLARLTGAKVEHNGRYPGWQYSEGQLEKRFCDTYRKLYGGEPHTAAIHAGLECGIILAKIKEATGRTLDCIAVGPDIFDIHTPDEAMSLASCERLYYVVKKLITEDQPAN